MDIENNKRHQTNGEEFVENSLKKNQVNINMK